MNTARSTINEIVQVLLPLLEGLKLSDGQVTIYHLELEEGATILHAFRTNGQGTEIAIWENGISAAAFCSCEGWTREMPDPFLDSVLKGFREFITGLMAEYTNIADACRPLLAMLEPAVG